jgi:hypothetical protein
MKRLVLLFVCGALVASAQEVRLTRSAMLKSERTIVSLRAGTVVDVLARDGDKLTVRFNQHTGTIPANSLDPVTTAQKAEAAKPAAPAAPAKKSGSGYVNNVNRTKDTTAKHGQNNAQQTNEVLASN